MIIKPIFTKKTIKQEKDGCYFFITKKTKVNKKEIKKHIFKMFNIPIKKIRTMIYYRKDKSRITKNGVISGKSKKFKKIIIQFLNNKKFDLKKEKKESIIKNS